MYKLSISADGCNSSILAKSQGAHMDVLSKWDIQLDSIYSQLIEGAAKYCDYHAADLLYHINAIESWLRKGEFEDTSFVFAFYDCGIDGNTFALSKLSNPSMYGSKPYRAIWAVMFTVDYAREEIKAELVRNPYIRVVEGGF